MEEGEKPYSDISDIARHHIQTLQTIQPQGDYQIVGYSFGGKVAFEMAQQLRNLGHKVSLLAIIDVQVEVPNIEKQAVNWDETQHLVELAKFYQGIFETDFNLDRQVQSSSNVMELMDYLIAQLSNLGHKLTKIELKRILEVYKANIKANSHYLPQNIEATPISLFRAKELGILGDYLPNLEMSIADPSWGWQQLSVDPIELQLIPGNHFTMIAEPNVQVLAQKLKASLVRTINWY